MPDTIDESKKSGSPRVLITGASGFVGSAIAEHCRLAGMQVRSTGRKNLTASVPGYFCADVTDSRGLIGELANTDCVIHAAGLAHQFRGSKRSAPFLKINVNGTENVARSALNEGVGHFVLISSVAVYGPHGTEVCDESSTCEPPDPYGQSKYLAEQKARQILKGSDTRLTILRLATVYGEGDPGNMARLMRTIDRGRFVWVGDGSNRKSLIHKVDVGNACVKVVRQALAGTNVYNVSAPFCTMREVVEGLAVALERVLPRWRIPASVAKTMAISFDRIARRGKQGRFLRTIDRWLEDDVYDAGKFNRELKFTTKVSLSEGLGREVEWYRQRA